EQPLCRGLESDLRESFHLYPSPSRKQQSSHRLGCVARLLGVHRRMVPELGADLPSVDQRLNVEAALRGSDYQVEAPHLAVRVEGGLAPRRGGCPFDQGLGDLRFHVLAPSYGATARTRFCATACRVWLRSSDPKEP